PCTGDGTPGADRAGTRPLLLRPPRPADERPRSRAAADREGPPAGGRGPDVRQVRRRTGGPEADREPAEAGPESGRAGHEPVATGLDSVDQRFDVAGDADLRARRAPQGPRPRRIGA